MLKKGQRVKINSGGEDSGGGHDGKTGIILDEHMIGVDMKDVKLDNGVIEAFDEDHLTPVEPSIDNLMVGDVVEHSECKYKVLFIGNDNFVTISREHPYHNKIMSSHSKLELKAYGYKVISPKTTMTIQEAEEKLNVIIIKE